MADALVVGAIVTAAIDVLINKMASPEVVNFFKRKKLNDGLLKKLKVTMRSVHKVLNDAEVKQITDPDVKAWLDDLRDAVYEADDFLDGIAYETLQLEMEAGLENRKGKAKLQNFLSSLNRLKKGMGKKEAQLEKILQNLDGLIQQKDTLGLIEGIGEKSWSPKIPTTSLLGDSVVYGRDDDKEEILKLLLSDDASGKNLGVIPIVGMGGIGKTTLAQLVYKDNMVQQHFDPKAWVCVSEEFDILKVTKDILKEVGSVNCDVMTANQLHLELEEQLKGKKFLLVLDDVWNDDRDCWDFLLKPLKYGLMQGSKIIVTTRNDRVASAMSAVSIHHLHELSPDDCWFVFEEHAFYNGSSSARGDLEEIGRQIVRKCKGLPLAAKSLGSLLRCITDVEEWEKVLKSSMWDLEDDKILPALRLSYHYLPSHLKQCFAYCALFPMDHEFRKEDLVLLWMAEGFLLKPKGREIEEGGNKYFEDLVSRSFFQQSRVNPSCFIMHDLINDLAKSVSGEFCFRYEDDDSNKPSGKARHVSYAITNHDALEKFKGFYGARFLRSFLITAWPKWFRSGNDNHRILDFLQISEGLRVLSLRYCIVTELPDSIGNLKHLRYLNLQEMAIRRLPESMTSLYNLQTLILYGCGDLVELPTNMLKLINLSHLDIRETGLQLMPPQMGKLMKLQMLTDFFVGKQSGHSIVELGNLQHLRGELCIRNIRNVVNAQDAAEANLKSKEHIKELELRWGRYNDDSSDEVLEQLDVSQHHIRVLEQLQPHTNVESLFIYGFGGTRFPYWLGDSSFSNIVLLKLSRCTYCSCLPPLGQLASLKELSITQFDAIVMVGPEFCGSFTSMKRPFGSLKILRFEAMPEWQEWICDIGGAFPLLQELYIIECPHLTRALPSHLPSLTTLWIQECEQLIAAIPRAPAILEMMLKDNYRFMELKILPSGLQSLDVRGPYFFDSVLQEAEQMGVVSTTALGEIRIGYCNLESLCGNEGSSLGDFTSLRFLKIWDCPDFVAFPRGGISASNLIRLELRSCRNLKWLPEPMHTLLPSLRDLHICSCPEIEWIPKEGFPFKLESLVIMDWNKLTANMGMKWDLQSLSSLTHFVIDVEFFPEKTQLPSTLTTLEIGGVQNLECLDFKGFQHLNSLEKLTIRNWPHLQSITIPEEGKEVPSTLTFLHLSNLENLQSLGIQHLTSLKKLQITDCPKLESIPEEGLPPTLTKLEIEYLPNLQYLGIQNLTFLAELQILKCTKLESVPEALPSSLSCLHIYNCPSLSTRCKEEVGEDWPKISQIPDMFIGMMIRIPASKPRIEIGDEIFMAFSPGELEYYY